MDIKKASVEELVAEKARLNAQADECRKEAKEIAGELDFRANVAAFEAMPEGKRRALAHVIGAAGIGSTAKVGTPGK